MLLMLGGVGVGVLLVLGAGVGLVVGLVVGAGVGLVEAGVGLVEAGVGLGMGVVVGLAPVGPVDLVPDAGRYQAILATYIS